MVDLPCSPGSWLLFCRFLWWWRNIWGAYGKRKPSRTLAEVQGWHCLFWTCTQLWKNMPSLSGTHLTTSPSTSNIGYEFYQMNTKSMFLSVAEHLHTERIELLQWPLRSNHTCSCRRWRCQPCWLHHGPSEMELLSRPWLRVRKAHSLQPFDAATRVQKEQRWKGLRSLHHLPGLPWCSRLCRWQLLKNNPGFLNMATEAASISMEEKSSVIMVDTHLCRMLIDSSVVIQNSYCSGKQKSQSKDLVDANFHRLPL